MKGSIAFAVILIILLGTFLLAAYAIGDTNGYSRGYRDHERLVKETEDKRRDEEEKAKQAQLFLDVQDLKKKVK